MRDQNDNNLQQLSENKLTVKTQMSVTNFSRNMMLEPIHEKSASKFQDNFYRSNCSSKQASPTGNRIFDSFKKVKDGERKERALEELKSKL